MATNSITAVRIENAYLGTIFVLLIALVACNGKSSRNGGVSLLNVRSRERLSAALCFIFTL